MQTYFFLVLALPALLCSASLLAAEQDNELPGVLAAVAESAPGLADNLQEGGHDALPSGTTDALARDFLLPAPRLGAFSANLPAAAAPDRSARTVWVRMFPLTNIPRHDPYGKVKDVYHAQLLNPDGFDVYDLASRSLVGSVKQVNFDFHGDHLAVGKTVLPLANVWLSPRTATVSTLRWDGGAGGVQLRGGFVFRRTSTTPPVARATMDPLLAGLNGSAGEEVLWSVISVVSINDYLKGVVPSEVSPSWPEESLRAQAIAARTYALYEMSAARAGREEYDLDPTTWYQSYRGFAFWTGRSRGWTGVESIVTNDAIRATGSKVVTYQGEIVKAYFSGNSGGITCTATECLHKDSNPPYLVQMKDAPGVENGEGGTWKATFTTSAIRAKLAELNLSVPPKASLLGLQPLTHGPSGRTWEMKVVFSGSSLSLDRDQTGTMMGLFGNIRSRLFQLSPLGKKGRQSVVGHGFGHGVGMSQVGAQLFARQGWSADRILRYFYRNATIRDLAALE